MEMKAHAYSPSSCGKSDEKPSLIHTRPSRRDGYRLFRLSAGMGGARATPRPTLPHWDHDVFDGFNCSHFPLDWLNPEHIV